MAGRSLSIRSRIPKALVAIALPGLMLLPSCGTTVPRSSWTGTSGAAQPGGSQNGSAAADRSGTLSGGQSGPGVTSSAPTQAAQVGSSTQGVSAPSAPGSVAGAGAAASSGGGSPAGSGSASKSEGLTPIKVGVATYKDTGSVSSLGFQDVPAVDGQQIYSALIKYINAHGGFGGRQVQAVYYEYPIVTSTPESTEDQAACATFTQDNHVAFVLADRPEYDGVLLRCLAKAQIPLVYDFIGYMDESLLRTYEPLLYLPDQRIGEDVVSAWISGLEQEGYFAPWPSAGPAWPSGSRIGLVTVDDPGYLRIPATIPAALARYGLKLTDTAKISLSDTSTEESDIDSSMLTFRSEHIDHVLIMDSPPQLTIRWPTAAQSQSYYPRFGLNSYNTLSFSANNVPSREFQGALGIGWMPFEDVQAPQANATATECEAIARQAGIDTSQTVDQGIVNWICAIVLLMKTSLDRNSSVNPGQFQAAVEGLGTSWQSPFTFGTSFGPGRHDGAAFYRHLGFNSSCSCFQYTSPTLYPL